jgi:CRP-like cAMP-binding protein
MIPADSISKYSFFSGLSGSAVEELARHLETTIVPAGMHLIKEGTPPDYFYFIKDGEAEVTKRTRFGQTASLTTLSGGQGFGEMALLTCSHRRTTVTAKTEVSLYRLSKKAFEDVIMADASFRDKLIKRSRCYSAFNNMKTAQPFALIEPEKLYLLTEKMQERTFPPGETIVTQGEKGDFFYIIKSGRVEVLKARGDQAPERIASLESGESFGEEALIREEGRNATVRTMEETTVLALDKADFDKILKTSFLEFSFPEEVPLDRLPDFVFIDARIKPEYEEEHIEGSINIPIEELRQRYHELDKSQQYLTYCTNDSRGMVAAFLLSSQGYNARNLRSGLSGWEGPVAVGSDGIHYPQA